MFDFADLKPSALSFFTVGIMAVCFIVLFKWFAAKSGIDSLQQFAGGI